ncbi:hypothetical protein PISMIDRAFT_644067, partial [Pisolithus microcarpus 441]
LDLPKSINLKLFCVSGSVSETLGSIGHRVGSPGWTRTFRSAIDSCSHSALLNRRRSEAHSSRSSPERQERSTGWPQCSSKRIGLRQGGGRFWLASSAGTSSVSAASVGASVVSFSLSMSTAISSGIDNAASSTGT